MYLAASACTCVLSKYRLTHYKPLSTLTTKASTATSIEFYISSIHNKRPNKKFAATAALRVLKKSVLCQTVVPFKDPQSGFYSQCFSLLFLKSAGVNRITY